MSSGAERPRTGVLGGTFNPIHVAHLRAANEAADALDLERVLFVPSGRPPHKNGTDGTDEADDEGDVMAPAELRLAWVERAIAGEPRFAVDRVELDRDGPSFLVETLSALGERLAPERPVFLVGQDAFREMDTWRDPKRLFELAHYAVMTRPPMPAGSLGDWLPPARVGDFELAADGRSARHRQAGTWVRIVEITPMDVSSSEIRRRLREGRSVRYLLPDAVHDAIVESGVYSQAPMAQARGGRNP